MADGPTGPDFGAMLALINASQGQGGSGCAPILMGVKLDVNMGANLSIQGKGFNSDGMIAKLPQGKPGLVAKLLKDMGCSGAEILEGMKKVSQAAPVQQANMASITGSDAGHGLGGGFAASSMSQGGGSEIG
jgi:hypothetical protein